MSHQISKEFAYTGFQCNIFDSYCVDVTIGEGEGRNVSCKNAAKCDRWLTAPKYLSNYYENFPIKTL